EGEVKDEPPELPLAVAREMVILK
ncbi:uncharacterized protein METZ01_LOCUS507074, partial [marine metagenome]